MQAGKVTLPKQSKRNALHITALYASTDVMELLTTAHLFGLDTLARDKYGHSPDECFMECRNAHCAVARKPFDVEMASWLSLMESARRQNARNKEASLDLVAKIDGLRVYD